MARIKVPYHFYKQTSLAEKIIKQHKEEGDDSLLKNLLNMDDFEEIVKKAIVHDNRKGELKRLAELETEKRNNVWDDGEGTIRFIAQYLKSYFRDNPHALGKWGFIVDSSPQRKKNKQVDEEKQEGE